MRTLGRWTIGWVALAGLWLLYQGDWNAIELYAAASAAALTLLVAFVVSRHTLPAARVERRWLVRAVRIPWQVVREFGVVTLFLARRRPREGEFRRLPFPAGGARPAERGRRVFIALATGYSPNSYVLDVDEEHSEVLVHVLARVPGGQELV
jgi:multisubunit Na+/H+ antiporter MnhE subunit